MKKDLGIFGLLAALCLIGVSRDPHFLSAINFINLANIIGLFGIFSIGSGLVIIAGGIDLSIGSMIAVVGVLLPMALREWHWPWPAAIALALAVPMFFGWTHGWLVTRLKIQPFIVTLCGLLIYRGMARTITNDVTKGFGDAQAQGFGALERFCDGTLFGVPMPFVILIIVTVVMWFVLHRSIYGRYLLAVGRNEDATRFSGINTRKVISSTYIIAGLLTGISGILFAFWVNSISPATFGTFYETYGIAAAVLGGCSLRGGEGSIIGIVIGVAVLQVLQNLVNLLGVPSPLNYVVMGGVVLVGVIVDELVKRHSAKKLARAQK
ncbi:MAG TPA: ABC transporter permease [Candidatus Angelobacter sp.]|nr:ABC transporter permease [Candidatus Angelobacter sp.]